MSSEDCDLSILVINWNTREMTRDCLQSVYEGLSLTPGMTAEVILVDNASEDASADMVVQDFPDAVLIRNAENRGFAAANNQAFKIAKGRQILLLNSDTLVHGNVLGASVDYLDAHPKVGAMGCRVINADGTTQRTCSMFPSLPNLALHLSGLWKLPRPQWLGRYQMTHWDRDDERPVETISGCYLLVRREVIDEVGLLDEAFFFFGEETDWCARIRAAGWPLMFSPVGEITHYGGGSVKKLNHRRDVMLSEAMVRLHRKHGGALAAVTAYILVVGFNLSRAFFWSLRGLVNRSETVRERAQHFRAVMASSRQIWPKAT